MEAVVTENVYKIGDELMRGGRVLYECPISIVGMRERRAGVLRELLHSGSFVLDLIRCIVVLGCLSDGLVRADHLARSVDQSAAKSL